MRGDRSIEAVSIVHGSSTMVAGVLRKLPGRRWRKTQRTVPCDVTRGGLVCCSGRSSRKECESGSGEEEDDETMSGRPESATAPSSANV
jgi:hypothetical protein